MAFGYVCVAGLDVRSVVGDAITVNLDISFCPRDLEVDSQGNVAGDGIEVGDALLNAELVSLWKVGSEVASAANEEPCFAVTVRDNEVASSVGFQACVTATANGDGSLTVLLRGVEIELPERSIVGADGVLDGAVDLDRPPLHRERARTEGRRASVGDQGRPARRLRSSSRTSTFHPVEPQSVAIDRARIDRQIKELALEHADGGMSDEVYLSASASFGRDATRS